MPSDSNASSDALVSIICRSIGRPSLADALASIAAQTYPHIELILVNAGNSELQEFIGANESLNYTQIGGNEKLSRAVAANQGLNSASGQYCMFLDDDDWVSKDHVATLVEAIENQSAVQAVYSCTQRTLSDGTLTEDVFRQPYDSALLLRDNFMPIHSVLFAKTLVDQGCKFDEQFDIFEDWDFWLQVSQHTSFKLVDQVTAFYRGGGESETNQDDISVRYKEDHVLGKARAKLFDKWLNKWSGNDLNNLLGSMDQAELITDLQNSIQERDDQLAAEHQTNLDHQQQISNLLNEAETLRSEVETKSHQNAHLNEQLKAANTHAADLETLVSDITHSVSWKLTKPLRYIARLFSGNSAGTAEKTSAKKDI